MTLGTGGGHLSFWKWEWGMSAKRRDGGKFALGSLRPMSASPPAPEQKRFPTWTERHQHNSAGSHTENRESSECPPPLRGEPEAPAPDCHVPKAEERKVSLQGSWLVSWLLRAQPGCPPVKPTPRAISSRVPGPGKCPTLNNRQAVADQDMQAEGLSWNGEQNK